MATYLDSSLVVSLYAVDANSQSASIAISSHTEQLLMTPLCQIEVVNAFGLHVFRKLVSIERADFSIKNFERDMQNGVYELKPLPDGTFAQASRLSRKFTPQVGIRTADLLHVAAALELGANTFFSFDLQQRKLAEAVGLALNPLP